MFKNIWYWSNKKWAMIYLACFLMFGLQIYCFEVKKDEVQEVKKTMDSQTAYVMGLMYKDMTTMITIERPKPDSNQIVIDRLKANLAALKKQIKTPPVRVITY